MCEAVFAQERAADPAPPAPADPIAQLKAQRATLKKELKDCTKQMRNEVFASDFRQIAPCS